MDKKGTRFLFGKINLLKTSLLVLAFLTIFGLITFSQKSKYYRDSDEDGYGDPHITKDAKKADPGWVANMDDCDDGDNSIHPGAPEVPNNCIDEDCNGIDLDTLVPTAEMSIPTDASSVPVDTTIVVHVKDNCGVDQGTVFMTVNGADITSLAASSGDSLDLKLTYDPASDFGYHEQVDITVDAQDEAGNVMPQASFSFMTAISAEDNDGDGILNTVEDTLGTDPSKRTLFVRPKIKTSSGLAYWVDFITVLFPSAKPGYAEIPALTEAGIEVVVLGPNLGHDYSYWNSYDYDPAADYDPTQGKITCDIMEVVYDVSYCTETSSCNRAAGHTFFDPGPPPVWSWDTKGFTPATVGSLGYRKPLLFKKPLDYYFSEGAYPSPPGIAIGAMPVNLPSTTANIRTCTMLLCDAKLAGNAKSSPLNMNDLEVDSSSNPPLVNPPDDTVEFNEITFHATGEINTIGSLPAPEDRYFKIEVLRRTLVHEMGHALGLEHCDNPYCIMYQYTETWELYGNGQNLYGYGIRGSPGPEVDPVECEHSPGNIHDIRAYGGYSTLPNGQEIKFGVYNREHQ